KKTTQGKIITPKDMVLLPDEKSSRLVKSVFKFQGKVFALGFAQTKDCYYGSIFNTENGKEYFRFQCVEPKNQTEAYGIGGGTVVYDDHVILALGEPSAESEEISLLAQNDNFYYGKILRLELDGESFKPTILSKGFRNPQGLRKIDGKIYSTEHGPHGGDELNHVQFGKNYGWPLHSLGVRYNGGRRFPPWGDEKFVNPIYSFLPSVGLSDLRSCPKVLKTYYKDFTCILMSALRGESLYIALLDSESNALISLEKLPIGTRIREFALGEDPSDNSILVASDLVGLLKIDFLNFR
ncbi:MAG: PQQ-dependent sugar dehydrogenase, partial [Halobacteriovoraceae bacterium]|nr:PQQ-dependent sugar dehydrogenase [Halobacteriovoraceae bacterium]